MADRGVMLILKGIAGRLHDGPAREFARREGFQPEVLDASGETGAYSHQTNAAMSRIKKGGVTGLYGFSGGGYNLVHLWRRLTPTEHDRIQRVVVVGSPGVQPQAFRPCLSITIYDDDDVPHMDLPDELLKRSCWE